MIEKFNLVHLSTGDTLRRTEGRDQRGWALPPRN
ncbi:MAG: hypothetical protein IPF64_18095 [Flavobacteriales bacterium]|nr:hypothetical protein [Flavobacteriales bacterium]